MRVTTEIHLTGKNTGILVPPEAVESLGGGKRAKVVVTVGGHTYRSSIASMGGLFLISLSAENRAAAGVAGGDIVEVDIELDTAPRVVEVPADLAAALAAEPAAAARWDALSYSHQRQHVLAIEGAKTSETRARRVTGAVQKLLEG